jgi:tRNA pseudouridine32 synthase/23S rRNA pseudouridine746 synthase
MSAGRKKLLTAAVGDPEALGPLLAARLGLSPGQAAALVARGAVHTGGRRLADATATIPPGTKLTVFLPEDAVAPAFRVVWQDAWAAVVDKPSGLPSQATRGEAEAVLDAQVRARWPDARMMHRLDRDASGLVLFARAPEARAPLQHALEAGQIARAYVAVVGGRLEGAGEIALRIGRDPRDERRRVAHPEAADAGQPARSRYRALSHGPGSTVVALELETGRTHQLRVHLAAIGHPILGDRLYDGAPAPRLYLHATRLAFPHPDDGREIEVLSPPAGLPIDSPP